LLLSASKSLSSSSESFSDSLALEKDSSLSEEGLVEGFLAGGAFLFCVVATGFLISGGSSVFLEEFPLLLAAPPLLLLFVVVGLTSDSSSFSYY
jgi:hypothetical protein